VIVDHARAPGERPRNSRGRGGYGGYGGGFGGRYRGGYDRYCTVLPALCYVVYMAVNTRRVYYLPNNDMHLELK